MSLSNSPILSAATIRPIHVFSSAFSAFLSANILRARVWRSCNPRPTLRVSVTDGTVTLLPSPVCPERTWPSWNQKWHILWIWNPITRTALWRLLPLDRMNFGLPQICIVTYCCWKTLLIQPLRCYVRTSLIRRYIGLHRFLFPFTPFHQSPCTIESCALFMYDTILRFLLSTIQSCGAHLYDTILWGLWFDINLGATATTILRMRGVQIPIDLVSSATDSLGEA